MHRRKGRPNLLDHEFLVKVKEVVTGVLMAGGVVSKKMVIEIGTRVIKANCPSKLKDFGGHIALTEGWARRVLKSMECFKRKGTTGKIEPSKQFLLQEKLTFERRIALIIEERDIPKKRILNLDQTLLPYASPRKYTFNPKDAKTVPIKSIDHKRQITATFTVSMTEKFYQSNSFNKGKRLDVSLDMTFRLILMSPFLTTIARIRKNQLSFPKKVYFRI